MILPKTLSTLCWRSYRMPPEAQRDYHYLLYLSFYLRQMARWAKETALDVAQLSTRWVFMEMAQQCLILMAPKAFSLVSRTMV